jgi:apolipoprotein N-acyltransferase
VPTASAETVPGRGRAGLFAAASGVAWGASQAIETRPWLAAIALAPLLVALLGPRPVLLGWLSGIVAWCVALPWIVPTITTYGQLDGWVAGLALLLLAAILGLYHALFAGLGARLFRRGDALSLAALPALWVALEWARGAVLSGFPWNLAAYAWIDLPGALPLASWAGAWGVSALVVAVNAGVARAAVVRRWEPAALAILLAAAALPLAARLAVPPATPGAGPPRIEARIVQPNTPNRPFFDTAANRADYRRLVEMSAAVCAPGRLLLWPESAAWPRSLADAPDLRWDVERLARRGCAILLNSSWDEGGRTYNSVLLVERARGGEPASPALPPGLRATRADKRHLVPFGEYVPLRSVFPFLGKIARAVGDFSPAREIRLLDYAGAKLGAAVCYEVIFPGETAALVAAGAQVLVTVTNDAWYGDTAAPRQHLRAARFRAAENRRWLLRAAVTGISAAVRPDGALAGALPVDAQGVLAAEVEPRSDRSPFARAPWLVPALCSALALLAIVRAHRAGRAAAPRAAGTGA